MDFLNGKIKTLYFKYLSAAFGSALITSIYSIVDMAMVGQYHGPEGSAALAVVAPVWNIIYSLGLLMGIGGSVLFSTIRGKADGDIRKSNQYFTASVIGSVILAGIVWLLIILFDKQLLVFFGAQDNTLTLAREYVAPIKFAIPFFLFNQMLAAYLRNDKNPALATGGVLAGGIFNIFGDYFFVFTCDMGAYGAGLATAIGSAISFLAMLSHFFMKKNTLRLVKPEGLLRKLKEITVTGFSTFFIDVAMGILTILFNRQIMIYLGTNALAVYGVIVNISTFVQCCAYSVGQASQPIISTNYGAGLGDRIRETLKYALGTVAFFSSAYRRGAGHCANHYPVLRDFFPAPAAERVFYLLFPGSDEAENRICCLCGQRASDQRHFDLPSAGSIGGQHYLVRNAGHRISGGCFCYQ